jgi:hypothetical protein
VKRVPLATLVAGVTAACLLGSLPFTSQAQTEVSPIYGVAIPEGYRHWEFIAPSEELGKLDQLRIIVGNDIALKAYRDGTRPFPDGSIIAKVAWQRVPSAVDDRALGAPTAFVPGTPNIIQIMVKDSKRYHNSGGWGYGRFLNGKPTDLAQHETCFACHNTLARANDFVFTRYAP